MIFVAKIKKQQFAQFTLCSHIKSTHKKKIGLDDFLSQSINSKLAYVKFHKKRHAYFGITRVLKRLTSAILSIIKDGELKSHGS